MASSFFSDESGTSDVESRRVVSLPKANSPTRGNRRNLLFDDSDLEDAITLGSPTSPEFAVQGASGASGASPRRAAPGFFGDADAEAFDGFAEVAETPEAAPAKAKSVAAKPKAKTLTKAKAPGARPKAAERPASPASVPSSPARSINSTTNSPAGRPRPGSLASFSDSIRAAQARPGSPNQAKARAVSPNQAKARAASPASQAKARAASPASQAKARAASPASQAKARAASPASQAKARAASPASQAKARAASPASQAVPKRSASSRSTTPKASPRSSSAVAKVPPARIASKAAPKAHPKSGASLEVPEATSRSPSPRSRSPTRPTSRSPTFPRSPSDSRPSSPSKPGSPSPRRAPASPKSPPSRSPSRTSPKSPPLTRPGSTPRTVPQRRTIFSPSSSEGSPLTERQLYREVERKQKELDELKRRLEEEQVKAEKREDEVSSLQRRRQNTWEWQLDQQRNEWLPMLVEDERGRLLHQVSLALAQTRSSLSNGRVQVRKSLDQMQMENQELQSQVGQLESELQNERGVSTELRHVTEELKQKVVKIEKESANISADVLRLQEQEELAQRSPLEEALQELQDTLQGERQKLLDAHEKMKTFQQEAAQNRIQLQESRKRLEDFELETKRNMEEKELDLRTARAEGRSAAAERNRRTSELEEDLMALRNETKELQRAAKDNQRLLLRSSFETWHSCCLQVLLQRSEELGQNSQEGLGRQLAAQEEKVKAAFTRASDAERDFASEKFTCQRLREELREMRHKLDSEAIVQRSKAAAQEVLLETHRMERQTLEEQLAMVRCRSEETQEACAAREAMRCAEVQAQLFAQAEMSESRKEVAQLRAELAMSRASEMSSVRSPRLWRSPVQEDSLTHALIHASMGSVRSKSNGYGADSVNSSWDSIKVRAQRGERYVTLLQSSSGAVASLLKQVRRLDDAHRTLSGGRNAVLAATPAQLRAVRALEKQTSMLERTNQEWTASIGISLEEIEDSRQSINGFSALGDDEVTASERGAVMVKMLRRTEGRLERLQERLQRLLSNPMS